MPRDARIDAGRTRAQPPRAGRRRAPTKRKPRVADQPAAVPLDGTVAVVAGATRGAGRGIARGLAEAGAFVYCTGRSVRGNRSPYNRPETIDETAEMIVARGGAATALRVDHTIEAEVEALFARVDRERGRLDVLVDAVAGEDPMLGGWGAFWKTDLSNGAAVLRQTLLSHVITVKYGAPLMMRRKRGLIVEVTEGDTLIGGGGGNVLNDLAKGGFKALAIRCAEELRPHRVAVLAITPGYLRSESMLQHWGVTEDNWRDAGKKDPNFLESETPLFIGRAVAALAADPKVFTRTGDVTSTWELARHYGFTDYDGRRPDLGQHMAAHVVPTTKWLREGFERYVSLLERAERRARELLTRT